MPSVVIDDFPAIKEEARTIIRLEVEGVVTGFGKAKVAGPSYKVSGAERHEFRAGSNRKINDFVHAQRIRTCRIRQRWEGTQTRHRIDFRIEAGLIRSRSGCFLH